MAYIGAEPVPGQNREVDDISSGFNGSTTAYTLQVSSTNVSPESANNILINLGGVLQNPDTDYTIAASTITFTTAPAAGLSFFGLILGAGINTATVADNTIGTSKLINQAVTNAKVNNSAAIAVSKLANFVTNNADNRIITGTGTANTINAEANLTLDSSGNLSFTKEASSNYPIQLLKWSNDSTTTNGFYIAQHSDRNGRVWHEQGLSLVFGTSNTERVEIDSTGRLLIRHNSARANVASIGDPHIQHEGLSSDDSAVSIIRNSNSNFGGSLILGKTRGTSVGSNTSVADGDQLGTVRFAAADGTDCNCEAAFIQARIDGTPGSNDTPGKLLFATTADGSSSGTTRMVLDAKGNVAIGTTTISDDSEHNKLIISGRSNNAAGILIFQDTSHNEDGMIFADNGSLIISADRANATGSSSMRFRVDGSSEKMRIDSDGKLLVGTTSGTNFSNNVAEFVNSTVNAAVGIRSTTGASGQDYITFKFGGGPTACGGIRRDGTTNGVELFSNSDRRIKTNILDMDNTLDKINQLPKNPLGVSDLLTLLK